MPVREQRNRIECLPECTAQKKGEPSTVEALMAEVLSRSFSQLQPVWNCLDNIVVTFLEHSKLVLV